MAGLVCDICGGKLMSDPDGEIFNCESCGTRYPKERVIKMFAEITGKVEVEGIANLESLQKRALLFLEDGDFEQAKDYFDKVLDSDPEYAPAYVGLLMAENGVKQEEDLGSLIEPVSGNAHYQKALRFGDVELRGRIERYSRTIDERMETIHTELSKTAYIKWQLLKTDESAKRMLFISKNCIQKRRFDAKSNIGKYSEINRYLNGEFLSWLHQSGINRIYETPDGKIFLLSIDEARQYFSDDASRVATYEGNNILWWLRSPGSDSGNAAVVDSNGGINRYGRSVDFAYVGVRPAFWLNWD